MITALVRSPLRVIAAMALIALTLGVAACGDSDDGDKQAAAGTEQSSETGQSETATEQPPAGDDAAAGGSDEQQLRALMDRMRKAFADLDGQQACPLMAKEAQAQIASAGGSDCAKGFETIFAKDVEEDLNPSDLRFDIAGDKASVSGYTAHTKDRQTAQFVKEGGDWKVVVWFTN
jgi:hypothetical protein